MGHMCFFIAPPPEKPPIPLPCPATSKPARYKRQKRVRTICKQKRVFPIFCYTINKKAWKNIHINVQ